MFGNFLSSLGEKLQRETESATDKKSSNEAAVDDLFSSLTQPKPQQQAGKSGQQINAQDDPFAYLISPDRTPVKPHVSKQKPSITYADETTSDFLSNPEATEFPTTNFMESLPLFSNDRESSSGTQQQKQKQQQDSLVKKQNSDDASHGNNNNMWKADEDDDSDFLSADEVVEEQKSPAPAPEAPRKSNNLLSSLVSKAGDFIKQELKTQISQKDSQSMTATDHQKVIQVLTQENKQIRDVLENQQQKVEDLQEEIEVHKSLEEDAHESNEELLYKVKYLEELARDNGHDLSSLKRVEELGQEKKSLMQQVAGLERQMRLLENMKFSKDQQVANDDSDDSGDESMKERFENPKRTLNDLKSLFELNRIKFNRQDEARVLTAIYMQDKPVIRLYREMLFRQIAQKALQSAECIFKQTNSTDCNGNQMSKLMLQNRRYKVQNDSLTLQLNEQKEHVKKLEDQMQMQKVTNRHKLGQMRDKAVALASEASNMQKSMTELKTQAQRTQASIMDQEVLDLSVQRFNSYLGYFMSQQNEQKESLQSEITELSKQTQDQDKKLQESEQHNKETFEQLSQVQSEKVSLQEDLGEAQEAINHLQLQCQNLNQDLTQQDEVFQKQNEANLQAQNILQQEIQTLQQRPQAPISGANLVNQETQQQDPVTTSPEAQQQISELEKMLEEREEEILELMQEVNKLQEQKQQSPEVVNTLQILKSKLKSSQLRFQSNQQTSSSQAPSLQQEELKSSQKTNDGESQVGVQEQRQDTGASQQLQQTPILIVDEGVEKSSQGSHLIEASPDQPRNQQNAESFNSNVRLRLQEVQKQRLDRQNTSPEAHEPYSRIVNDGKESNFFSSMVYENSTEKQNPVPRQKLDDLFGFLMDPVAEGEKNTLQAPDGQQSGENWSEAFGFPGLSQTSSKQNLTEKQNQIVQKQQLKDQDKKSHAKNQQSNQGWGEDDSLPIDEDVSSQQHMSLNANHERQPETIQIDMGYECSPSRIQMQQRGEIMLQESLENSPIKKNRTSETAKNVPEIKLHKTRMSKGNEIFESHGKKQSMSNNMQDQDQMYESPTVLTQQISENSGSHSQPKSDSHHKRSKELPTAGPLDSSMDYLRKMQRASSKDDSNVMVDNGSMGDQCQQQQHQHVTEPDEDISDPKESYKAAIMSFVQDSGDQLQMQQQPLQHHQNTADIDSEIYDQLMEEESKSIESAADSLLESSPFNNSFARQEVDMVVATIRKNSCNSNENTGSSLSPVYVDDKKVNISNLSDLVPEDPIVDKLNSTDEDQYQKMMRPGELNEVVEEVEEDVSDDVVCSPKNKILPNQIHERADSATVLEMQSDSKTRKVSEEYQNQQLQQLDESPSMQQSSRFESMLVDEKDHDQLDAESPCKSEEMSRDEKDQFEITIPPTADNQLQRVTSARSHHRRQISIGENPFKNSAKAGTSQSPESQTTPQNKYETLAEFTKENLISYQEDGKTISGTDGVVENENTADFDNFKEEIGCDQMSQEEEEEVDPDRPTVARNVNGSGFFSRDWRVLKNANYGNIDQGNMILAKLQEEFGSFQASKDSVQILAEAHEQNQQSFAEPPPPEEPEVSACSIDADQLNYEMAQGLNMDMAGMNNLLMGQSFENNLRDSFQRGSLVEDARVQSLLGSMIQGNQSITEQEYKLSLQKRGDENSIEQNSLEQYNEENTDDGIPQVDVYVESNRNSLASKEDKVDDSIEQVIVAQVAAAEPIVRIEDDAKSLETVGLISDENDISPTKMLMMTEEKDANDEFINQQQQIISQEEDEDDVDDLSDQQEALSQDEQEDDKEIANDEDEMKIKVASEQELDSITAQMEQLLAGNKGGSSSRNQQKDLDRKDTPILEDDQVDLKPKDDKEPELRGWADESDDISLDENSLVEEISNQNLQQQSPDQINMSLTMQAEVGDSDRFKCPNGHNLTVIDGKQHALPDQECSAYCGMANKTNSNNWLRCRECFYKVCYDCYHCENGHEMQNTKAQEIGVTNESCSSCGNSMLDKKLWMCENRVTALKSGDQSPSICTDNSLICQECLGSGVSFITSPTKQQRQQEDDISIQISFPEKKKKTNKEKQEVKKQTSAAMNTLKLDDQPNLEDIFASASQSAKDTSSKSASQIADDPFSMLLPTGTGPSSASEAFMMDVASSAPQSDSVKNQGKALLGVKEESDEKVMQVGGTGGGWGDDEDDIDID